MEIKQKWKTSSRHWQRLASWRLEMVAIWYINFIGWRFSLTERRLWKFSESFSQKSSKWRLVMVRKKLCRAFTSWTRFFSSEWRSFGLFIGVEKLKLMMTWHLYIKFHALLRRLFTSSAHLFCHILIACYPFAYWHDSFWPCICIYFFSTHGLNA